METRLQKYIADCGVASRRKAEALIVAGRVQVNGRTVTELGTKVTDSDRVQVDGREIAPSGKDIYILLNKPAGYLSTVEDDRGRQTVMDLIKDDVHQRVYPVGRLDFDSEGLLLLTNDGALAYALTHPKHEIEKTYMVVLDRVPTIEAVEKLKRGVMVDGRRTLPAKVDWVRDNVLHITIHEGRNRQIRKMAEAVGYEVDYLKRLSMGMLVLGNTPLGRWRHLTKAELAYLGRIKNGNSTKDKG